MRGPGEKELETDRRIAQDKITHLRQKLKTIERQGRTQRKQREKIVRVALVGYTNVGKSTLMRVLSKEPVYTENKLFATVSSTVRKVVLKNIPFLLTDTIGFIRKLPHTLIECFRSTLDEVREADVLVHVIDISHPAHEAHSAVVHKTLQEIGAGDIPQILVFNKIDEVNPLGDMRVPHTGLSNTQHGPAVLISAAQQMHIDELKDLLFQQVYLQHMRIYPNYLKKMED